MTKFAVNTDVSAERTLSEIQATLKRYGASRMAYAEDDFEVSVMFEMQSRRVRFTLPLPDKNAEAFVAKGGNQNIKKGSFNQSVYDQAVRSKWRALLLAIKAKLESVESEIETFDEAFMAQLVLPNNETVGKWAAPQIELAYSSGKMPPLLSSG